MADPFVVPRIDYSWLSQLPTQFAQGEQLGRESALRSALSKVPMKDGQIDFQGMAQAMMPYDPQLAISTLAADEARKAREAYQTGMLGLEATRTEAATDPTKAGAIAEAKAAPAAAARVTGVVTAGEVKKADTAYDAAKTSDMQLGLLEGALEKLPDTGWLAPGAFGPQRVEAAKRANQAALLVGKKPPFDVDQVSAAEQAMKITTGLGFTTSRTLGAREAMQTISQAIGIQPGLQQTRQGYRKIIAMNRAINKRETDYKDFLDQWLQDHNNDARGVQRAFDQKHPVSEYVDYAKSRIGPQSTPMQGRSIVPPEQTAPPTETKDYKIYDPAAGGYGGTTSNGIKWSIGQ